MKKSRYHSISKLDVIQEYSDVSHETHDYAKAKWGSHDSMINRFNLGLSVICYNNVNTWLDIGCGTGLFFAQAEKSGYHFDALIGVDITSELVLQARKRTYASSAHFFVADLESMPQAINGADLVTLIGVLQQCGTPPQKALSASTLRLRLGGHIFLTTKNIGWQAFQNDSFEPEKGHSWFDYDELEHILLDLGIKIVQSGGFIPRENRVVPLEHSHTFYIHGKKVE